MSEVPDEDAGPRRGRPGEVTLTERQLWELAAGESVTVEVAGDHERTEPVRVAVTPPVPPAPARERE